MPNKKNIDTLKEIKEKLENSSSVVFANYAGLPVNQINELRAKLVQTQADAKVYKNTLVRIALADKGNHIDKNQMEGPTLIITSKEDPVSPIKALFEYIKTAELPKVKFGILQNELLTAEKIETLAKLPGKEQLMARFVGVISNPARRFVSTINNPRNKFVWTLRAIKNDKVNIS